MENNNNKQLNITKINEKKVVFCSTKESLKDVTPIAWSKEVLSGNKNVLVTKFQ